MAKRQTDTGIIHTRVLADSLTVGTAAGYLPFGTAGELNEQALQALEQGRGEEADRLWSMALWKEPNHADAFWNRCLYRLRTGQLSGEGAAKAVEQFETGRSHGLLEVLHRELGTNLAPVKDEINQSFSCTGTIVDVRQVGEELVFSLETGGRAQIIRCGIGGGTFYNDHLSVGLPGKQMRWSAISPDGALEAVAVGDDVLLLYDLQAHECITLKERLSFHPRTTQERLRLWFSPDGKLLAVSEPRYKDRPRERTILFEVPTLRQIAEVEMKFVCMTRDSRPLVRGREPRRKEALYQIQPDGTLLRVFSFEEGLAKAVEWAQDPAPFLCYQSRTTDDCFWLDETFRPRPVPAELLQAAEQSLLFDPERRQLFTVKYRNARLKLLLWDLEQGKPLSETKYDGRAWSRPGEVRDGSWKTLAGAVRGGTGWRVCVFADPAIHTRAGNTYGWSVATLPACIGREEAPWRHSPERTPRQRQAEQTNAQALVRAAQRCRADKDLPGALEAWRRLLALPGAGGTECYVALENLLEGWANKDTLRTASSLTAVPSLPEPLLDRMGTLTAQPDGLLTLCSSRRRREGIWRLRPDGTVAKKLDIPDYCRYTAARGAHIYSFSEDSGCALFNLRGERMEPEWEDWPAESWYCDLDGTGTRLLYRESYAYAWTCRWARLRMKDMETGMEYDLPHCKSDEQAYFLPDGSVLVPVSDRELLKWHPDTGTECARYTQEGIRRDLLPDESRRCVLNWEDYYGGKSGWVVLDADLRPVCSWKDDRACGKSCLLIPGTGLVAYLTEGFLNLYDYRRNKRRLKAPCTGRETLYVTPDGRELYLEGEERRLHCRLGYDYTT